MNLLLSWQARQGVVDTLSHSSHKKLSPYTQAVDSKDGTWGVKSEVT
jgi:hypothetical protein